MHNEPPQLAERLLRGLVPGRDGEAIAGDLREHYMERGGGRLWYWVQVLTCARVLPLQILQHALDLQKRLAQHLELITVVPPPPPRSCAKDPQSAGCRRYVNMHS